MSQENVEIVRRGFERFNDGDVDGFLELCTADVEIRDAAELPGARVSTGHGEVRAWHAQLLDAFNDLRFEPDEFIDAGDRVLVAHHAAAHGRLSGVEVDMPLFSVYTVSSGKVTRLITYRDRATALEAVGLSE